MAHETSETPALAEDGETALRQVAASQRYRQLIRERSRFSWMMTALMLVVFFGYILLIAFAPGMLARPIGEGATTLGIPLGIGVILFGIVLTGVYVHRANSRFDPLIRQIVEEEKR